MKIGIDCGHTLSGADYGAVGIRAESDLTREVGTRVISKLQALGHTVIKCYKDTCASLTDSLNYRTNTANANNVDLYVSIHFNCYNCIASGTEVWTYGGREVPEATRVLNNIVDLGYTNRGIKDGSGLYVLRHTKMKSMLIECCFCDNTGDMNKYNAEDWANAIVKGLVGQTVNKKESEKVKNLVIYGEGADKRAAEYLADYLRCPICNKDNLIEDIINAVENLYMVGGSWKPTPNTILLSGQDRFETLKAVTSYIK